MLCFYASPLYGKRYGTSLLVFLLPEIASADGVPDGTVRCSCPSLSLLWHGASACTLCIAPLYIVWPVLWALCQETVTFMSGFKEFCVDSIIHTHHVAESTLSRQGWPLSRVSFRMVSMKQGWSFIPLFQAKEVLTKYSGGVCKGHFTQPGLSNRSTRPPATTSTWTTCFSNHQCKIGYILTQTVRQCWPFVLLVYTLFGFILDNLGSKWEW